MDAIETKEIRGLSAKTLITLIGCTITIVVTIVSTYFSLQSAIKQLEIQGQGRAQYDDLRIKTVEIRVSTMELKYNQLSDKYEDVLRNISEKPKRNVDGN